MSPEVTRKEDEAETEVPKIRHTESETEGCRAHMGQPSESGSVVAALGVADSDSRKRRQGLQRWAAATVHLIGRFETGRHPVNSPQGLADQTSIRSLFDEYVWPFDLMDDEGDQRLETGLRFAALASKNGKVPMAYLTKLCKRHITQPEGVFS